MLGLGQSTPAASSTDLVFDTSEATFMQDVIEASQTVPVIVDFWAPWCGPCKTLGPMLEAAVTAAKGAVKMAKVNVDENQMLAGQLRIQSIPTVYAFFKGQPIDAFQGALPQSELEAFVKKVIEASGGDASGGLDEAIASAEEMLEAGAASDAAQVFAAILEEDPKSAAAFGGLARAYLALGEIEQAEAVLNGAPAEISNAPEIETAYAQIALARQAANAGPLAELEAELEQNPHDMTKRLELATALHAAGQNERAVELLLEGFKMDREWNDGAMREQLFTIFNALPANDPVVLNGRRKLSSLIFA